MADHMRTQIRGAAATLLAGITALASGSDSLFAARTDAIGADLLPALAVSTADESTQGVTSPGAARVVQREVQLVVEAVVRENDTYAETLDGLCKEVEALLAANMSLGVGAKWIDPPETNIEFDGRASVTFAVAVMTFRVVYFTAQNAPDVAL